MEAPKGLNSWGVMMSELAQGRELAKQLQNHLDPSTPPETRNYLIERILFTYNNLLQHMASTPPSNNSFPIIGPNSQISFHGGGTASDSPPSVSHCSDPENHRRASKRRKILPKWVKTVKVESEEGGVERTVSDGYSWRKYGQKVILGAAFPRGYYRCTHRNTRGCSATKQVQKSTEDSTVFQVIYKGHHTCSQSSHVSQPSTSTNPPPVPHGPKPEPTHPDPQLETQTPIVVQTQLKVETESSDIVDKESIFFGIFPLPPVILETAGGEVMSERFISALPTTSDSNHLQSLLGCDADGNGIRTPDSDVNEAGASGSDSPSLGVDDFTLDELIIDPNFAFDEEYFY